MKENIGFILFIVFVVIFILLLTGGRIIKSIKDAKIKAKKAAEEKEQKYRDETGRQQRQYHYSGKTPTRQPLAKPSSTVASNATIRKSTKRLKASM